MKSMDHRLHPRRGFLRSTARLMIGSAMLTFAGRALASLPNARSLVFHHTHTGERLEVVYAVDDRYLPGALTTLNHFLRDHYSGKVGVIDPRLFDLLHRLQLELGCCEPFHVISGYRSPETNATLKATRGGGVARHSLHMDGKAIDIRLPGVPLTDVREAAISLKQGGVGYYPREQFVHVDTGRVRYW
jgi:uncharacterized protein YcbK (DUF882 family)